jgi:hypothetical protein
MDKVQNPSNSDCIIFSHLALTERKGWDSSWLQPHSKHYSDIRSLSEQGIKHMYNILKWIYVLPPLPELCCQMSPFSKSRGVVISSSSSGPDTGEWQDFWSPSSLAPWLHTSSPCVMHSSRYKTAPVSLYVLQTARQIKRDRKIHINEENKKRIYVCTCDLIQTVC